jgi:transcription elongation factor SPT6
MHILTGIQRANAKEQESNIEAPMVMAISWGDGDPKKDAICVVCIDETGDLREHAKFDNLKDKEPENEFLGMVKRWKPHRIVVGGFSPNTHRLAEQVKQLVFDPEWVKAQKEAGKPVREEGGFDARDHEKPVPVNYVQDAVARIFQHSKRAAEEFGTLPITTRYCIGLARYAQSPLNEYAALGPDITAITFDQDAQHLVGSLFLLRYLTDVFVDTPW